MAEFRHQLKVVQLLSLFYDIEQLNMADWNVDDCTRI